MKKYILTASLLAALLLTSFVVTRAAFDTNIPVAKREKVLELTLAYKFGELPDSFNPDTDPTLQAIRELSFAESKYMIEYIYVFNRAGYPQELTFTETLISYDRQRELATIAANWVIKTQIEKQNDKLPLDDLPPNEQQFLQVATEGLSFVIQGKGDEYLLDNEKASRDTILYILRKYNTSLFAPVSGVDEIEKDAETYRQSQQTENRFGDYCGYHFVEGPGAQIDYGLWSGSSGAASWYGDNDRYQTLCDHVVRYPVISQYLKVDHDGSYDGWCILNSSGGDGAWLARQRVYNGENVLYGGWKAQWCAVTGSGIAQHTRGG